MPDSYGGLGSGREKSTKIAGDIFTTHRSLQLSTQHLALTIPGVELVVA